MKKSALLAIFALALVSGLALPLAAQPVPEGPPQRPPGGTPAEPEPAPFELQGTVFLAGEGRAARLELLTGSGEKIAVTTDAGGHYRLRAPGPLRKATIELKGREGVPFHEFFHELVRSSGQRDFHLPAGELRVRIVDAVTGKPVPEAFLKLRNTFPLKDQEGKPVPARIPGGEAPTSALSQSVDAGADGVAIAYYLQAGQAEFSAGADGYTSPALQKLEVAGDARLTAEVRLQPQGEKAALQVLLPNGEKAAGAAVLVLATLEPMKVLSAGATDKEGRIELPKEHAGAHLAVRHPGAAFHIGRWQPGAGKEGTRLQLEPAAEQLTLVAKAGGQSLPYAEVALVIEGQRLTTHLLYQLTGASPMTDGEGRWTAGSLPKKPLQILVFSRQDTPKANAVRAGQHDDGAAAIPYPWPPLVEVAGIE